MQCGVACLAMICRHYGKRYSVEDLSQHRTTYKHSATLYIALETKPLRCIVSD